MLGALHFLAAEVLERGHQSPAADVYSFGIMSELSDRSPSQYQQAALAVSSIATGTASKSKEAAAFCCTH